MNTGIMIIKMKLPVWFKSWVALYEQERNAKLGNHVNELLKMEKEKS